MPESPLPTMMTSKCSGVLVLRWLNATSIFGSCLHHRCKLALGGGRALRHTVDERRRAISRCDQYHMSTAFNQLEIGARHFRRQSFTVYRRVEDLVAGTVEDAHRHDQIFISQRHLTEFGGRSHQISGRADEAAGPQA